MEAALCRVRDILRSISNFEANFNEKKGVTLNECMVLCSISSEGRCTSGKLAELLGLSVSNTSKIISSVEKKELVERFMGVKDKRQMLFELTAKGEEVLLSIKNNSDDILEFITNIKKI